MSEHERSAAGGQVQDVVRPPVDRSIEADAKRMRWLLSGNGYFMEEQMLCGHPPCSEDEQDTARREIDEAMNREAG